MKGIWGCGREQPWAQPSCLQALQQGACQGSGLAQERALALELEAQGPLPVSFGLSWEALQELVPPQSLLSLLLSQELAWPQELLLRLQPFLHCPEIFQSIAKVKEIFATLLTIFQSRSLSWKDNCWAVTAGMLKKMLVDME